MARLHGGPISSTGNVSAQNIGSFVTFSQTQLILTLENLKYTKEWFDIEGKHLFAFSAGVK